MRNIIASVERGSIAEELGILSGDVLLEVNETKVSDVFDYRYLIQDENVLLLIETKDGEQIEFDIEKDLYEDLGLIFESGLMDKAKGCHNKCIFCFIDQLPKGLRETLYFKDDDMRLSFLKGNYVTMTNMSDVDIDKIIYYHLSPINISVHTTDGCLRKKMLNNKNAEKILEQIKKLAVNNIDLNFQVVLCPDINDGVVLDKTIETLSEFIPNAKSLSVVPVGLTKEREKNELYPLRLFAKSDAVKTLEQINKWQKICMDKYGTRFVYASDEFYIKAEVDFPENLEYENFPQLENGVGMISLMKSEFDEALKKVKPNAIKHKKTVSIATGIAAYEFIKDLSVQLETAVKNLKINVFPIENEFFGKTVTVSGLITGGDIIQQLYEKKDVLGEALFIPSNALKADEDIFLDDTTVSDVSDKLEIEVISVESTGDDFINKILNT